MRDQDFDQFSSMLDDVASLLKPSEPLTATARAMFFRALAPLTLQQTRAALDAHVRDPDRGRFFPRPADVLAQIPDNRPGADEAWAIAVRGHDENATIVWTQEMAQAWGIARSVMQLGDEIGARVAFKDAYNRLSTEARAQGKTVQWTPSLGHDTELRHQALSEAASLGRIGRSEVAGYLPPPATGSIPPRVREALAAVRERLTQPTDQASEPSADAISKEETVEMQRETFRKVTEYAQKFRITYAQSSAIHARSEA